MLNPGQGTDLKSDRLPLARFFASFASKDFRWLSAYYAFHYVGMSMELLAQGWLVLIHTDSALWVGIAIGIRGLGQIAFGTIGGLMADRLNRRVVLAICQSLWAGVLFTLGFLIVLDHIELWHILVAALLQGLLASAILPASEALIYDIVGRRTLLNGVAMRHGFYNFGRIFGSILAGFLMGQVGMGAAYLALAGIVALSPLPIFFMKPMADRSHEKRQPLQDISMGIAYAYKSKTLRHMLLFNILMEIFGFSYQVLLPVMARDVLMVGATGLGFLSAAISVGGFMGTAIVVNLGDYRAKGYLLTIAAACASISLLFFALSPWYAASLALITLVGASITTYDATMAAHVQLQASEEMRGRILGLYGLTFGCFPLGGFLVGAIASAVSAPFTIGLGAVVVLGSVATILLPLKAVRQRQDSITEPASKYGS